MKKLSLIVAFVALFGMGFTTTMLILGTTSVPTALALVGWAIAIVWLVISMSYQHKLANLRDSYLKVKRQQADSHDEMLFTSQKQRNEIGALRNEKLFLMAALENYSRRKKDDKS